MLVARKLPRLPKTVTLEELLLTAQLEQGSSRPGKAARSNVVLAAAEQGYRRLGAPSRLHMAALPHGGPSPDSSTELRPLAPHAV